MTQFCILFVYIRFVINIYIFVYIYISILISRVIIDKYFCRKADSGDYCNILSISEISVTPQHYMT